MKNVLLIAYTFPPSPGIGGRRWAKFAKYLVRNGYVVHVVTAENDLDEEVSLWNEDVNSDNIKVYRLQSYYPAILSRVPETIADKINYRVSLYLCKFKSKGTPFDKAIFWRGRLLKKCKELIRTHNIENVISTGAPFRNLFYATMLKEHFPNINIISDFRDPWTEGKNYGFQTLSNKKKQHEIKLEKAVCMQSDFIIAPNKYILDYLENNYKIPSPKFKVIPHGYDEDDMPSNTINKQSDKVRFIFLGTFYEGADFYLKIFLDSLRILIQNNRQLKEKIVVDFYTWSEKLTQFNFPPELLDLIRVRNPVTPKKLLETVAQSDFVLAFFVDKYKDYISTKFIELLPLGKPFLYFGPEGSITNFLKEKEIGIHIEESNALAVITSLLSREGDKLFKKEWTEFSYHNQTLELMKLLK